MLFAHPPRMQPRETDLVQLVDTVIGELTEHAKQQNTRLDQMGADSPLRANVDPTAMAVAIKAIAQNGLEAVQRGGVVTICAEALKDLSSKLKVDGPHELATPHSSFRVPQSHETRGETPSFVLTVTDTGPGIPPDVRPNIFDPFFSGREAGRGLGLGLSKAWRIVDLHGGRIEVESDASSGTTFRVILPSSRET
jgi:signal transduction histidine kinase